MVTVLTELAEEINPEKLLALTEINIENAWVQRLGYLFDFLGQNQLSAVLEKTLEDRRIRQCALQIASPITQAKLNKKWQIWVNVELESDL